MPKLVLLAHAGATLYLTGLIWFVQVVHYPLFGRADRANFPAFALAHQRLTTWVVLPPMFVELSTALLLLRVRPAGVPDWQVWAGLALAAAVWLSTAFVQVPRHGRLALGYDAEAHAFLVLSNWLRTACWTARGVLALAMCGAAMGG